MAKKRAPKRTGISASEFRRLALSLPESLEGAHMGHADFRIGGKIFATLGPQEAWGMVKLTPEQQAAYCEAAPQAFEPCSGAWGRRGATKVLLEQAETERTFTALVAAWRNTAPPKLIRAFDEERENGGGC